MSLPPPTQPSSASSPRKNRPASPAAAGNNSPAPSDSEFIAKTFTLTREEIDMIEQVRRRERLVAESAAVRLLIRDGYHWRASLDRGARES